jgi:hypothetical protein
MNKMTMIVMGVAGMVVLSGCGQSMPNPLNDKECATLEKKMIQTDTFIENVSAMDPSHVDEVMVAIPKTEITTETTKPKMLRDAKRRKAKLEAEFQSAGCKKEF